MDDVIYEEFKGTGNQELHLVRQLAEKRIFPAVDLQKSGTRKEELLLSKQTIEAIYNVRQTFDDNPQKAAYEVFKMLKNTESNAEFCQSILTLKNKK